MKCLLALLLLYALTALRYPWENVSVAEAWLQPSFDLVVVLAVGCTLVQLGGFRRWIAWLGALAVLLVPLYRFGLTIMPAIYGKEFDPWDDLLMLDGLVHLLTHSLEPWAQTASLVGAVLVFAGIAYATYRLVAIALRASASPRMAMAILVAAQSLVAAWWVSGTIETGRNHVLSSSMIGEVLRDAGDFVERRGWQNRFAEIEARALAESEEVGTDLARLDGADVLVIFVESYGRAVLRKETRAVVAGWLQESQAELGAAGWTSASSFTMPSVRGGHSSIAHAELLTGIRIATERIFNLMMQSELTPLSVLFDRAGYRTLNVHPATPGEWPEGKAFFGFDENVFLEKFGYEGHKYHFGMAPDQFALDWVRRNELTRDDPVFMLYASVISHSPYSNIPPYFADWDEVAAPRSWEPAQTWPITWWDYIGHPQVVDAYLASLRYSLETVTGFAQELQRPTLLLVLGDHQPPEVGQLTVYDTSFDVPIHAITNEPRLLAPFVEAGFAEGMVPPDDLEAFPLERFSWMFRRWFSSR